MKDILFAIIIIVLMTIAGFGAGQDYERNKQNEHLQKIIDASIMTKKKHKQKQIELPIQEYKTKKIRVQEA